MNWFEILKVEDIDFDRNIRSLGFYQEGNEIKNDKDMRELMDKIMFAQFRQEMTGEPIKLEDIVNKKIRINHAAIYAHLKRILGRNPTDKETIRYITRVIMHEGTHAGMGEEQDSMSVQQAEYGAYTGQFPESTYIRLKEYLKHPQTKKILFPPEIAAGLGIDPETFMRTPDIIQKVGELIGYVDGVTEEMPEGKEKDDLKEKLTRLEMSAKTSGKPLVREWPVQESPEKFYEFSLNRYGRENKDVVDTLARINNIPIPDTEEKMAGAVTTTSAPSMFNNKVIRRRKKKKED